MTNGSSVPVGTCYGSHSHMIEIPKTELALPTWKALIVIAREWSRGWTLIGAQMVALHG